MMPGERQQAVVSDRVDTVRGVNDQDLGRTLRSARVDAGLSQSALAARLGTTPQAVSLWELGERALNIEGVERFLAACGRRLDVRVREDRQDDPVEALLLATAGVSVVDLARLSRLARALPRLDDGVKEAHIRALVSLAGV